MEPTGDLFPTTIHSFRTTAETLAGNANAPDDRRVNKP
jgi:hypothetical protein